MMNGCVICGGIGPSEEPSNHRVGCPYGNALDQIDADERRRTDDEALMRQAMQVLRWAQKELRGWPAWGVGVIDALRARLSEGPAAPEATGQEGADA